MTGGRIMTKNSKGIRILITTACFIIIVAGMREAKEIIVPFLLSIFIASICSPPLAWLKRKKVPGFLAIIIMLTGIIVAGFFIVDLIGTSVSSFSKNLPQYQAALLEKMTILISWLGGIGLNISSSEMSAFLDPGAAMKLAAGTLTGFSSMLSQTFIIILTVVFILTEATGFSTKLRAAAPDPEKSLARLGRIAGGINRYLAIKTVTSLATGILITAWLLILKVDNAPLWGFLAFLLNYIPNIGSIIASIPAILMALIQLGTGSALLTMLGYIVINMVIGNILEPWFMGRRLGLSTLIIFLSLIFWAWVLGPIGMILSVPLTMIVKIGLESYEDKRWIATLMGSA